MKCVDVKYLVDLLRACSQRSVSHHMRGLYVHSCFNKFIQCFVYYLINLICCGRQNSVLLVSQCSKTFGRHCMYVLFFGSSNNADGRKGGGHRRCRRPKACRRNYHVWRSQVTCEHLSNMKTPHQIWRIFSYIGLTVIPRDSISNSKMLQNHSFVKTGIKQGAWRNHYRENRREPISLWKLFIPRIHPQRHIKSRLKL